MFYFGFFIQTGRDDEAYQILQNVFTVNHPDLLPSEFEVITLTEVDVYY